jgi:hypothetical protein
MMDEVLYTRQLSTTEKFLILLKACHRADMFSEALILAEQFPDRIIKKKEQQNLLFFRDTIGHMPWEKDAVQWHTYTSGRIFTDQWELRWARQQQEIRIVYLGVPAKRDWLLSDYQFDDRSTVLADLKKQEPSKKYYLFGERLSQSNVKKISGAGSGDFAEARIPRLLRYPPANYKGQEDPQKTRYMQLHVCEYVDGAGNVVLSRFQCLEAVGRR